MDDLTPVTRTERLLDGEDLTPTNREEMFIKRIYDKTQEIPEPVNRKEYFLKKAGEAGGDVTVVPLSVTANGTYSEAGKAYSPVKVNVAPPEDSYQLKSITTPTSLATFEASAMPMPSLKVSVEAKQDLHGYDHPWVGGAGKNKLDSTKFTRTHKSGQSNVNWARWDEFIPCTQNSYTLSCGFNVTLYALNVDLYDANQSFIETLDLGQFSSSGKTFSVENQSAKYMKISIYNSSSMESYDFSHAQLELGSTATSFEPYSNICPISGWDAANVSDVDDVENPTVTQTTTITLPQTVYGGELDMVNGILKITDGYIASYNGETLPSTWISSEDVYAEGTTPTIGAEVCYELAEPIIINLTPTLIKSLNGQNNLSVDCGEVIEGEYFIELGGE